MDASIGSYRLTTLTHSPFTIYYLLITVYQLPKLATLFGKVIFRAIYANHMKLSQLKLGQQCIIEGFTDELLKLKLMEMGCLPGEVIELIRVAPLGDPMAISVGSYILGIRKNEADTVIVKPV